MDREERGRRKFRQEGPSLGHVRCWYVGAGEAVLRSVVSFPFAAPAGCREDRPKLRQVLSLAPLSAGFSFKALQLRDDGDEVGDSTEGGCMGLGRQNGNRGLDARGSTNAVAPIPGDPFGSATN